MQIDGVVKSFRLEEVEAGVYEGIYTISVRDRITAASMVTANLRVGNQIATEILDESLLAGAVGGAVAGNEIEKRVKKTTHYEVTVRLQGGGAQTISYATAPAFKVGDKVRVENGTLVLNL